MPDPRPMSEPSASWDRVGDYARGPLIAVGGHTFLPMTCYEQPAQASPFLGYVAIRTTQLFQYGQQAQASRLFARLTLSS